MKRIGIGLVIALLLLTGCTGKTYRPVEHVGRVSSAFETIVEENLFYSATVSGRHLMRCVPTADGYVIKMYDLYGYLQVECAYQTDTKIFGINSMIATSDGGILFAVGFSDHYNEDGFWESERGVCSRVVKCDAAGQVQWDVQLDHYTGQMLQYVIEQGDAYYFFGDQETPQTDEVGVVSPTDIFMMKMSKSGEVLETNIIGGTDYDHFEAVEQIDGRFAVYGYTQSTDGDFDERGSVKITVTKELQATAIRDTDNSDRRYVGLLDGRTVRQNDEILEDFEDGTPTAVIDYGTFYIIVSENATGLYEKQPSHINDAWEYTETVYGAYDKKGKLLWKTTVDSSPDWDAVLATMEKEK